MTPSSSLISPSGRGLFLSLPRRYYHHLSLSFSIASSLSFVYVLLSFSSIFSSLPGKRGSLARGPGDVVLINTADCTLIKLSVNGPAPASLPGVRQDGSLCKQLQIYGTAVATLAWPCNKETREGGGREKKPLLLCSYFNMQRCFLFVAAFCFPASTSVICVHYSNRAISFFFLDWAWQYRRASRGAVFPNTRKTICASFHVARFN